MVERLDAHGLVQRLVAAHPGEIDALLGEALDIVAPGTWDTMAPEAREQVRGLVLGQVEQSVGQALVGMGEKAEDLIDLRSEESRVGKGCVSKWSNRVWPRP